MENIDKHEKNSKRILKKTAKKNSMKMITKPGEL